MTGPQLADPFNYSQQFVSAKGFGLTEQSLNEVADYLEDAPVLDYYLCCPKVRFIFEILDKQDWSGRVGRIADEWVQVSSRPLLHNRFTDTAAQNDSNTLRAATAMGRAPQYTEGRDPVRSFSVL